jgi:hypothetical protein
VEEPLPSKQVVTGSSPVSRSIYGEITLLQLALESRKAFGQCHFCELRE